MAILKKTAEEQKKIDSFKQKLQNTINTLEPYSEQADITELKKAAKSFDRKIEDFYKDDRKLNIGVIGQVKAGKSTFLNTLLFDGKDVLPSARTPKTAVLTRIEYSENNNLSVEYYDRKEWADLENYAKSDSEDNEHQAAKEIMNLVKENGIDVYRYIGKNKECIEFSSADELMEKMNEYVGENGSITPVVKSVTVNICRPELQEISVTDTPGLNDVVLSRTLDTRDFIKKCDVVFFLSHASHFLDVVDMQLIAAQLPQDGVVNLVLIGSQFDSGIFDELRKFKSVSKTAESIVEKQTAHAKDIISIYEKNEMMRKDFYDACKNPIFVSSLVYNASLKDSRDYTKNEAFSIKKLNKYGELSQSELRKIGNIDTIKERFQDIITKKDIFLADKAKNLVPNAENEYSVVIRDIKKNTSNALITLQTNDKDSIEKQRKFIKGQITGIKASLENVLGELLISVETYKNECMRNLRDSARQNSHLQERQGTEWHTKRLTSYKHDWGLIKWGRETSTYSYSTTYTYLAASDALENIRNFSYEACSEIESAFTKAVDIKRVKQRLLSTILENFDTSDENFDINSFRHIVEITLNKIEFPVFKLDVSEYISSVSSRFSGEIRDSSKRAELQKTVSDTIDKVFDKISEQFLKETVTFKSKINDIKTGFENELLKNINDEYDKIQNQLKNKEQEIEKYMNVLDILKNLTFSN